MADIEDNFVELLSRAEKRENNVMHEIGEAEEEYGLQTAMLQRVDT